MAAPAGGVSSFGNPRVMIFRRSLIRELTATAIAVFLVLLAILFTNLMLRLLARAAGGAVAPEGIVALLGFNALFYFNILLSVTVFLAVLMTLSRWYRDSEMVVWSSSGQGPRAWLVPILIFAAPFVVVIVALSLYLSPWAEQRKAEYERQLENRDELVLVAPGLFKEFHRANLVVFLESLNPLTGAVHNVFLHSVDVGRDVTTVAASGHLEQMPNGDRFIVLEDGRRYEGTPGTTELRVVQFEHLGRRIEPAEQNALPESTKSVSTPSLLASGTPQDRAELFWRVSVPISAVVLTLLAIPLSYVNPRMGRSFNFIAALLLYLIYNNCLNIVQSFIAQGKIGFWAGLFLPHLIAAAVALLLFNLRTLRMTLRRGSRDADAAAT